MEANLVSKKRNGIFVCIEGPNCAGKTTFIQKLSSKFCGNYNVLLTKEPTNTELGNLCRSFEGKLNNLSYAYLICADRCNHVQEDILPYVNNSYIVICDRYIASSLVYQNFDGVPNDIIWELNKNFPIPEINIFILADEKVLSERLSKRSYFSEFEKRMTRGEELESYVRAQVFLKEKGYNCITFYNNTLDELDKNVITAYNMIKQFLGVYE